MTQQIPSKECYLDVGPGRVVESDIVELNITFYFV